MSVIRRRYYSWLVKAYFKRWYKVIFISVGIGIGIFFLFFTFLNFYLLPILDKKVQIIGYSGSYSANNLPQEILHDISYGLTKIAENGEIEPAAAHRWEIKDDGRTYIFYLKEGQLYHDKKELTAETLNFNFKDVEKNIIDKYVVELKLKESYSPFLSSVASPMFSENLIGLGDYKVNKVDINAGFVRSIILENRNDSSIKKKIYFYPTDEALKTAYALGEIDTIADVTSSKIEDIDFASWSNTSINQDINRSRLITLFYNNDDDTLSNKKIRQALNYAIPEKFDEGLRAYSSINPASTYFSEPPNYGISDFNIAKELLDSEEGVYDKTYQISTTQQYLDVAEKIAKGWRDLGLKVEVKSTSGLHESFQILLYPINLPQDPDQYTLWHSSQSNNIARYKSLRIDKLLEDGRAAIDEEERQTIYADFQKYIIDDVPASFLYFPYKYTISRS